MSVPDPSKTHPSAAEVREESNTKFETDLADLATRFTAKSGGGLSPELSADLALEIVLNEIVEQACLATGATGSAIVLERDGEMVCRASSGSTAPELGSRLDTSAGLSGECFKTKQTQWCDDTMSDHRADAEASERLGVRSVVVMPLLRNKEMIGVIELFSSQPYAFGVRDERTLEVLADRTLNNLDSAARPRELQKLELQKPFEPPKTPDLPKVSESQTPPDLQKTPEPAKAQPLYWSIRDQVLPGESAATSTAAAQKPTEGNRTEPDRSKPDRTNEDNVKKTEINTPLRLTRSEEPERLQSRHKHWPDTAPPRGRVEETSAGNKAAREDQARHLDRKELKRDGWNLRRTDSAGWLLGAAAVACAILLALVVGRHWGARNTGLYSHSRVKSSAGNNPRTENSNNSSGSSNSSIPAPTNSGVGEVPPGGLVVSENGREVFRVAPKGEYSTAADHAVGVNRASSVEPEGVMQLSPGAAESDLLQRVEPDYPEAAREQNIQGTVVLCVHIAADGTVQDVQVLSGPALLAEASTDAVKQWKFKPRLVKGSPVEMQTTVTLKFRLPQPKAPQ